MITATDKTLAASYVALRADAERAAGTIDATLLADPSPMANYAAARDILRASLARSPGELAVSVMSTEPITAEDWQAAVDAAHAALALEDARQYALVAGGPTVNVNRCIEILRRGQERGVQPSADAIKRFLADTNRSAP